MIPIKRYENECCGCATESYPCIGESCKNRNVPHYYCDDCKHEVDTLYYYGTQQLCGDCILKKMEKVE